MIKLLIVSILAAIMSAPGFGQGAVVDTPALNQRIAALYQQGKFDEAIP
ncbi:MAG: hypothetical protein H0W99_00925, partial [Acidobacteria bacterium]|nr:hypothetical protein [Acidobacteriota bacterium]